jgi:hypothetical protein
MAEFLQRELRVNETAASLRTITAESKARVPAPATTALYSTLPDGRVLDRAGNVVYTPKVVNETRKP